MSMVWLCLFFFRLQISFEVLSLKSHYLKILHYLFCIISGRQSKSDELKLYEKKQE